MMLVIPGHILFAYTIAFFNLGHTSITPFFILFYIPAAVLQIWILLHTGKIFSKVKLSLVISTTFEFPAKK